VPAKKLHKPNNAASRNDISGGFAVTKCSGELVEAAIVIAIMMAVSLFD
jgi:hypothetical protein